MTILNELSENEKEALEELKSRLDGELTPALKSDETLYLRFLRARDFNVNLSEDMLRKHITWRKINKVDTILEDFVPNQVIVDYLPLTRIGFDKEGSPLRFFDFGAMDAKGILKASRKSDIVKTAVSYLEDDIRVMKEQSLKLGKPVVQWTYLYDFNDYTFGQATHKPTIELLMNLFQMYEANYPERLKAVFAINSSLYFNLGFSIIKSILAASTFGKIFIFGKDGWQNELLKHIDASVLPVHLGGTRTDPDGNPMCYKTILHGRHVPEELYLVKSKNSVSSQPDVKKFVVSRMSKVHVPVQVDESGSMIEWEFETEARDIGFGLFYRNETSDELSKPEELVPKQRIEASLVSEAGMFKCLKPGTYLLVFDNSYSWIHRKEIYCKMSVISPNGKVIPFTAL